MVPAAAVTTHAKPRAQQQLARDLEVERAAMGSAVGLKVSARCSEAIRSHVDGWISCELQLCSCTGAKKAESEPATSLSVFSFFLFISSGGWVKIKLKLPHFHVSNTCRVPI